jgi:hypothetical protein
MANNGRCPRCDGPTVYVEGVCRWCREEEDEIRIANEERRQPAPYEIASWSMKE